MKAPNKGVFMRIVRTIIVVALTALPAFAAEQEWVKRSNQDAAVLIEVLARYSPEGAGQLGVDGKDAEITQYPLDATAKLTGELTAAKKKLEAKLADEKDPAVRQDLNILIDSAQQNIDESRLNDKYELPYFNVS